MRPEPSARPASPDATTPTRILDEAERLTQTRGFNGFSYADVASVVGTTKAALHYHYPSKADLGHALIARYADRFMGALDEIDATGEAEPDRLRRYVRLYADVLSRDRLCLCGMLAAEFGTLPDGMREALREYFARNETWLAALLERGRAAATLRFEGSPEDSARALTAALEGAMLLARAHGDPKHFDAAATFLLREFTAT